MTAPSSTRLRSASPVCPTHALPSDGLGRVVAQAIRAREARPCTACLARALVDAQRGQVAKLRRGRT